MWKLQHDKITIQVIQIWWFTDIPNPSSDRKCCFPWGRLPVCPLIVPLNARVNRARRLFVLHSRQTAGKSLSRETSSFVMGQRLGVRRMSGAGVSTLAPCGYIILSTWIVRGQRERERAHWQQRGREWIIYSYRCTEVIWDTERDFRLKYDMILYVLMYYCITHRNTVINSSTLISHFIPLPFAVCFYYFQ